MQSPQFRPQVPPGPDVLYDPSQLALRAVRLLTNSARILDRVLQIAASAMMASAQVAEAMRSLQKDADHIVTASTGARSSIQELDAKVMYLRGELRQTAAAALAIRELIGENEQASYRQFWNNRTLNDSIFSLQNQLRELAVWCADDKVPRSANRDDYGLVQQRIGSIVDASAQHSIVARDALSAVEKFQSYTTRIIRNIEQQDILRQQF